MIKDPNESVPQLHIKLYDGELVLSFPPQLFDRVSEMLYRGEANLTIAAVSEAGGAASLDIPRYPWLRP